MPKTKRLYSVTHEEAGTDSMIFVSRTVRAYSAEEALRIFNSLCAAIKNKTGGLGYPDWRSADIEDVRPLNVITDKTTATDICCSKNGFN